MPAAPDVGGTETALAGRDRHRGWGAAGPFGTEIKRDLVIILLLTLLVGSPVYWFESRASNFATDWHEAFYPATALMLHGINPYGIAKFHSPPWTLIPLIPFVLLGEHYGALLLFYFNLFTFAAVGYLLKARLPALVMFVLSPFVLYYFLYRGNTDALVMWGFLLPPQIGLFLVMTKPQIGIAVAVYWAWKAWKSGGLLGLARQFAPVFVLSAVCFLVFGNWLTSGEDVITASWNASFFPWSIPIGLSLLAWSLRRKDMLPAMAASPFLSPYLQLGSWSIALIALLRSNIVMLVFFVAAWTLVLRNLLP